MKTKYLDNQNIRALGNQQFNFIFDKDSGVSICWGKTQNDDPTYDYFSPQQITFEINNTTTSQIDLFNNLITLTHIKQQKEINKSYNDIKITNDNEIDDLLLKPNLKVLSTISLIKLNIKSQVIDLNRFVKFINKLKINLIVIIQCNNFDINKLKFITPNVCVRLSKNNLQFINQLLNNNFNVDTQIIVDKNNYQQIYNILSKQYNKKINGLLYLVEPFIDRKQLIDLQKRIRKHKYNIILYSCNLNHYNQKGQTFKHTIEINNCDCCTFSIYVQNNKLYPCQFNCINSKQLGTVSNGCWNSEQVINFRKQIIQNSFC